MRGKFQIGGEYATTVCLDSDTGELLWYSDSEGRFDLSGYDGEDVICLVQGAARRTALETGNASHRVLQATDGAELSRVDGHDAWEEGYITDLLSDGVSGPYAFQVLGNDAQVANLEYYNFVPPEEWDEFQFGLDSFTDTRVRLRVVSDDGTLSVDSSIATLEEVELQADAHPVTTGISGSGRVPSVVVGMELAPTGELLVWQNYTITGDEYTALLVRESDGSVRSSGDLIPGIPGAGSFGVSPPPGVQPAYQVHFVYSPGSGGGTWAADGFVLTHGRPLSGTDYNQNPGTTRNKFMFFGPKARTSPGTYGSMTDQTDPGSGLPEMAVLFTQSSPVSVVQESTQILDSVVDGSDVAYLADRMPHLVYADAGLTQTGHPSRCANALYRPGQSPIYLPRQRYNTLINCDGTIVCGGRFELIGCGASAVAWRRAGWNARIKTAQFSDGKLVLGLYRTPVHGLGHLQSSGFPDWSDVRRESGTAYYMGNATGASSPIIDDCGACTPDPPATVNYGGGFGTPTYDTDPHVSPHAGHELVGPYPAVKPQFIRTNCDCP